MLLHNLLDASHDGVLLRRNAAISGFHENVDPGANGFDNFAGLRQEEIALPHADMLAILIVIVAGDELVDPDRDRRRVIRSSYLPFVCQTGCRAAGGGIWFGSRAGQVWKHE